MFIITFMKKKKYAKDQRSTLLVSVTTSFITTFIGSALNLSVPDIEKEFGVSAAAVGWVVTIYMMTCAALAVPFGKIADVFQRKAILWIGILIFGLSSLAAVFSQEMWMLLVFRFCQGLGASMIFSTNIAILTGAFDKEMRGRVIGYSTSATYTGLSAGPVLGGFLNYNFGWRSIFIAAAAVSAVALYGALKKLPSEKKTVQRHSLDWKGMILYVLAIVGIMYGLSVITTRSIGSFVLAFGLLMLILFIRAEEKEKYPVMEVKMFKENLSYTFSNLAALLNYGATYAISYLISIYIQVIMGFDSQKAGLILIASPLVMALLSPVAGRLSDKHSPYVLSSVGMAICTAALVMFSFLSENSSLVRLIVTLAISGIGFALFTSPNTNAVMAAVKKEDYGIASSVLSTMRSIGHTVSMAIVTVVVGAYMGNTPLSEAPVDIMMDTIHTCFYAFTALCLIGIFMALKRKTCYNTF